MPRRQAQSEADQYWRLADEYREEIYDPNSTPAQVQAARAGYERAVRSAQRAESEGA